MNFARNFFMNLQLTFVKFTWWYYDGKWVHSRRFGLCDRAVSQAASSDGAGAPAKAALVLSITIRALKVRDFLLAVAEVDTPPLGGWGNWPTPTGVMRCLDQSPRGAPHKESISPQTRPSRLSQHAPTHSSALHFHIFP